MTAMSGGPCSRLSDSVNMRTQCRVDLPAGCDGKMSTQRTTPPSRHWKLNTAVSRLMRRFMTWLLVKMLRGASAVMKPVPKKIMHSAESSSNPTHLMRQTAAAAFHALETMARTADGSCRKNLPAVAAASSDVGCALALSCSTAWMLRSSLCVCEVIDGSLRKTRSPNSSVCRSTRCR